MIRYILLGAGVTLVILGIGRLIYDYGRIKGSSDPNFHQIKKGVIAALGSIVLGILLILKNTNKK
jgi:hypothetical protein